MEERLENDSTGLVRNWLGKSSPGIFTVYAIAAAFTTYFCMYAFRKPFTAAKFAGLTFFNTNIDLKTAFVISQIIGYCLSKYIAIKVVSEAPRRRRAWLLILLIVSAQLSLLLFAVLPANYKVAAIFLNGLSLGMVWGLVVWYLEGRQSSELLLAGLSCAYIVASSSVKTIGGWLMNAGVSEFWMPAATGAIFFPLYLLAVWFLDQLPQPSEKDVAARVAREPMSGRERAQFIRQFLVGLLLLLFVFFFLTAYRDFRDCYMPEIFESLGYKDRPELYSLADWPSAFGVMAALACLNLVKNNRGGLIGAYLIMAFGLILMGGSTLLLDMGFFGEQKVWWMILVGLGVYLAYVPFGSVLFDRLIASTGAVATAVFTINLADAIGYTGSIGIQLYKDLGQSDMSRFEFFRGLTYAMSVFGTAGLVCSCLWLLPKTKR